MSTAKEKDRSKVRIRNIFGRFFNSNNNEVDSSSGCYSGPGEISSPYNTVHRIHVGYDGEKFTGLPQPWMDTLLRDISDADQKNNPSAVVKALKFYAKTMMAQETHKQKFMLPKSQLPSDDDIDDDISENNRIVLTKADDVDNFLAIKNEQSISPHETQTIHSNDLSLPNSFSVVPPIVPPRQSKMPSAPPLPPIICNSQWTNHENREIMSNEKATVRNTKARGTPPPLPPKPMFRFYQFKCELV
ncbi:unnamed protein product [Dracunculus medinensis]|uniref:CRIB domain-containing protein n=1 Tax=Dracunculus medinensis TaxID=318479 RepID=A0A0N4U409_DRAME|nr:unnamed protein product [Dracunculus medinensis]